MRDEEMKIAIGARIKEERLRLGLSQEALASSCERLGAGKTSRQSIRNYEIGSQSPGTLFIASLTALGFDILYIFSGNKARAHLLDSRETALIDNYRASEDVGKSAIEMTATAVEKQKSSTMKKSA